MPTTLQSQGSHAKENSVLFNSKIIVNQGTVYPAYVNIKTTQSIFLAIYSNLSIKDKMVFRTLEIMSTNQHENISNSTQ